MVALVPVAARAAAFLEPQEVPAGQPREQGDRRQEEVEDRPEQDARVDRAEDLGERQPGTGDGARRGLDEEPEGEQQRRRGEKPLPGSRAVAQQGPGDEAGEGQDPDRLEDRFAREFFLHRFTIALSASASTA